MKETIVQVKYCYTEEELNEFLKTLHTEAGLKPRLHSIQYVSTVDGGGHDDTFSVVNSIVAVVQYFE